MASNQISTPSLALSSALQPHPSSSSSSYSTLAASESKIHGRSEESCIHSVARCSPATFNTEELSQKPSIVGHLSCINDGIDADEASKVSSFTSIPPNDLLKLTERKALQMPSKSLPSSPSKELTRRCNIESLRAEISKFKEADMRGAMYAARETTNNINKDDHQYSCSIRKQTIGMGSNKMGRR